MQDAINEARLRVWRKQPKSFLAHATIDADGTLAPTTGECKQGMDISYKGQWGYHPLVVSLAETQEPLYLANRPGNRPSSEGAAEYLDRAIALCRRAGFRRTTLRGDTDFTQTRHLDRWDDEKVRCNQENDWTLNSTRAGGIRKTISGYGSPGGSLGGQAPYGDQLQAELKTLSIGRVELGRVSAFLRESSPSLIGASILEHFVVTFDSRSESAYFDKYRDGPFARPSFGFSLAFEEQISVSLVWEDSQAARAGLRAGQPLTSINGAATRSSCDGVQSALRAMSGQTIELEWEGGAATFTRGR